MRHLKWVACSPAPLSSYINDTNDFPCNCTQIYTERIYTYMLHKEKYINYTENGESRPPMKNKDLTGKYNAKVIFHEYHEMIPRSVQSFCL